MKKVLFVIACLLVSTAARAERAESRVGYVNVARVMAESELGKQSTADLREADAPMLSALRAADADVTKAEEAKMAPSVVKTKRDLLAAMNDQRNQEAQRRSAAAGDKLRERIAKVVGKLAEERKLTDVFDAAPLFARFDLTADVIKRLNAETPVAADVVKAKDAEIAALKAKLDAKGPTALATAAPPGKK